MNLLLSQIRADGGTQSRAQLDWVAIDEYARDMRDGAIFPPIVVFHDGTDYWLADGFHRLRAAEHAGLDGLPADVRQGTRRDAVLHSVGANSDHGVRRTNGDKRAAVELLLQDAEWGQWSNPEIARKCGVSDEFVRTLRPIFQPLEDTPSVRKATRNGRTYTMDTANIGVKMEAEPAPQAAFNEWSNGAVGLDRDWSEDEFDSFVEANAVVIPEEDEPDELDAETLGWLPEPAALPVIVHNKDARFLADYAADVHLVITSPPYNVGIDYASQSDDLSTYLPMITDIWRECHKVMVDGARIAVVVPFGVGRNPYIPFDNQIMQTLIDAGFTLRGRIVWDKNTTGNRTSWGSFRMASSPAIRDTTECIIVAHKGDGKLSIPDEHKYQDDKGTFTAWLADGDYFMELAQDHWVIAPESAQRVKHPAPFPVELVKRLVHFYGFPGCHLLDPFGGSGTVGIAAKELGCRATLFEISQEYSALAKERISGQG